MALYRKYRPQKFSQIIGQEHIVEPLLKQLESGKITHAYIFSGPRGTGKTSTARIFAKALNCKNFKDQKFGEPCDKCENCLAISEGSYLDVLEIDAASNRGIDEIRDLREKIRLSPTVGQYKVYIIDEVHMLTNEAFNALLKTLEEPPDHAVFILATTELHKVPSTIQSRAQKYEFHLPNTQLIDKKLSKIIKDENWSIEEDAKSDIAKAAGGSYRDAEVLLEKVASINPKAKKPEVEKILGKQELKNDLILLEKLLNKQTKEAMVWLEEFTNTGGNLKILTESLISLCRSILLLKIGIDQKDSLGVSAPVLQTIEEFSQRVNRTKLTGWINLFTNALVEMKDSPIPQLPLELAIVEACEFQVSNEGTEERPVEVIVQTSPLKTDAPLQSEAKIESIEVPSDNLTQPSEKEETVVRTFALDDLTKNWVTILDAIKNQNNSLAVFLRGATPMNLDGDLLMLEVSYKFHKERLEEPKNSRLLSDTIARVLGKPVRIKGVVGEKKPKPLKKSDSLDEVDPVEIFGKLN